MHFNSIQFYLYSAITIQLSLGALQSPEPETPLEQAQWPHCSTVKVFGQVIRRMYGKICVCLCVYLYVRCACVCACAYVYGKCMCVCVCVCVCVSVSVSVCVCASVRGLKSSALWSTTGRVSYEALSFAIKET